MKLPGRVETGVLSLGRANTGAPARVAAAAVGAADAFAGTMGVLGQQMEEIERHESEAQYAEAITAFERDDLAIRQELSQSARYTPDQLADWGVEVNPQWRVDPATGEVEASQAMLEIYNQRIGRTFDAALTGITAPTAKGEFGRNIPRVVERIKADVAGQQHKLYLDGLAARHISAAQQHIENGNTTLAISSYAAARDAGAMSESDAQKYIDAAPAQAESYSLTRVLRSQNPAEMEGAAAGLRADGYVGALNEEERNRFANTLEANADAIYSDARKARYQSAVEEVLQADAGTLQTLMTQYRQPGASDRLGLEPTQLASLYQAADAKLAVAERRMRDRAESSAAELVHDAAIAYSRGQGLEGDPLGALDARYESGEFGAPGSAQAMRAHSMLNRAIIAGVSAKAQGEALHVSATSYWAAGLAIPMDERKRNEMAQVQFGVLTSTGAMSASEATIKVAATSKALPEHVQGLFKTAAFSPAHPQGENAAVLFDQIRKQGGADALKADLTDDEFDRMSYLADTTAANIPISNAFDVFERQSQMSDKQRADAQAHWRTLQKDSDTSFDDYLDDQMGGGFLASMFADQPELGDRARSEVRARAEEVYMAYGNTEFAYAQAHEWFTRRYGVSTLNGVSEFTFHGPETTYGRNVDGTPVITGEEARRQLVEDMTSMGYRGDDIVRIEPTDVNGPNGKPVYAVWAMDPDTGIVELLPQAWQPDPRRRLEYLEGERRGVMAREREAEAVVRQAEELQESKDPREQSRAILENLRNLRGGER